MSEDKETFEFEFKEIDKALNEDDIIKDNTEKFNEKLEDIKKEESKEEIKEKYEEFKEESKEDKINLNDKIENSISGSLAIIFDNLLFAQIKAEQLTKEEIKNINNAGLLIDRKYHINEKFGVEINFIASCGMPIFRGDRLEAFMNARKNKGNINEVV